MTPAEKVIALLKSEVGYVEKASNRDLDDPKANPSVPGSGNWTKYARDLDKEGFYNTKKNGYPWCDVFVDWLLYKCFGLDLLMKMTGQPKGIYNTGAGCGDSMYFYKQIGQVVSNPKPGDQIFFWNSTRTAKGHTGLVVGVDSQKVYTGEGNTSPSSGVVSDGGSVCLKSYNLNDPRIAGYGRPKYELAEQNQNGVKDMLFGYDISEYQHKLTASQIANTKPDFIIIRAGDGSYFDTSFEYFYTELPKLGIPVGVFWLTRATTVSAAIAEANRALSRLNGRNLDLPIYIDCEIPNTTTVGRRVLTDCVLAFAKTVKAAGYRCGIYTTENWLNNYFYLNELDGLEKWIARWGKSKPVLPYSVWQNGSTFINGIEIDTDYAKEDLLEVKYHQLKDITNKYYRPTMEKLIGMGVGSTGGKGEDAIIDLGEDAIRVLCILDKFGFFDFTDNKNPVGMTPEELIKEIGNILIKER